MVGFRCREIGDRIYDTGREESSFLQIQFVGGQLQRLYCERLAYVESHYPAIGTKEGRYIGDLSMGGWVALHNAFTHPDLFSKVGGHSPAMTSEFIRGHLSFSSKIFTINVEY
ncbi:alpha/beta hydrolase-fold protein [Paenibacillus sp. NEAU-GSW1]|uniref:alpha/beta hydrolase-fold protein n=1 Tax=Paenibacillus sp. NEAU-GSW1 TaxID=2682486 RepID=UPI00139C22E2|nr:hypothetical protein [Paenibacillus sp. NEAU-GSW1]